MNDGKPHYIINIVKEAAKKYDNPTIACFGLVFKANIDDLRESPALDITKQLPIAAIANILIVEPNINKDPKVFSNLTHVFRVDIEEALSNADIILGLVNHKEFKDIPVKNLTNKTIIDTCNIWGS